MEEEKVKRRPNELSVSRVKTIMKSSPDAENVSQESVYLVTKATELFIKYMVQESYKGSGNAKTLEYKHVAELVQSREELAFLREIVPRKCTLREIEESLRLRGVNKCPGVSSSSSDLSLYSDEELVLSSPEPRDTKADSSSLSKGTKTTPTASCSELSSVKPGSQSRTRPSLLKTSLTTEELISKELKTLSGIDMSYSSIPASPTNSAHVCCSNAVSRSGTPSTITLSSSSREMSAEGSPSPTLSSPHPGPSTVVVPASPMSLMSVFSGSRTPSPSPSYSSLSPEFHSTVNAQGEIGMAIQSASSDSSVYEVDQE
jgi:chromatin accessibility complex protein 1